jgi:hypothetical protein
MALLYRRAGRYALPAERLYPEAPDLLRRFRQMPFAQTRVEGGP